MMQSISHRLSHAQILAETHRVDQALTSGGYNTADLVLTGVAIQSLIRDICGRAEERGIEVNDYTWKSIMDNPGWMPADGLEANVVFWIEDDDQAVMFKTWFA
jgi:hypothetical protein